MAAKSCSKTSIGLEGLGPLAVAASVVAISQRDNAIRQRDQAIYNSVVAKAFQASDTNISLAAQLSLVAYHIHPTPALTSWLLNTENTPLSALLTSSRGGPDGWARGAVNRANIEPEGA